VAVSAQDVKLLREKTGAGIMDCKKALIENGGDFDRAVKQLKEKGLAEAQKRSGREAREGKIAIAYTADKEAVLMIEVNCETDFVSRTAEYADFVQDVSASLLAEGVASLGDVPAVVTDGVKKAAASFGENIVLRKLVRFDKVDPAKSLFSSYIHMGDTVGVIVEFLLDGDGLMKHSEVQEFQKNVALQIASMAPLSISRDDFPREILEEQKEIFMTQAKESGKPERILEKIVTGKMNKYFAESCLLEQKYVKDSELTIKKYLEKTEQSVNGRIEVHRFARFKLGEE
jgi:elongation factor Ts